MFIVRDSSGAERYRIAKQVNSPDSLPAIALFESGGCIITDASLGTVDFYNAHGALLRSAPIPSASSSSPTRSLRTAAHDKIAVLLVSEPNQSSAVLYVCRDDGTLKPLAALADEDARGAAISQGGTIAALSTITWKLGRPDEHTWFVSLQNGSVIGKVDSGFSNGSFSPGDEYFFAVRRSTAALIDFDTHQVLWSAKAKKHKTFLGGAFLRGMPILLECSSTWDTGKPFTYEDARGVEYSMQGTRGKERNLYPDEFTSGGFRQAGNDVVVHIDGKRAVLK